MSVPCKLERSTLSHDERPAILRSHDPERLAGNTAPPAYSNRPIAPFGPGTVPQYPADPGTLVAPMDRDARSCRGCAGFAAASLDHEHSVGGQRCRRPPGFGRVARIKQTYGGYLIDRGNNRPMAVGFPVVPLTRA
jgi:hypothetical protein